MRREVIGAATLYLGDALEVLPTLEPVDHVISDPPYEERMQMLHASTALRRTDGGPPRSALGFQSIETMRAPLLACVAEKNQGWLLAFCNVEGVGAWEEAIRAAGIKFKVACAWIKPDCTPKLNGQGPAIGFECIATAWCGKGHARWNGGGKRGVFSHMVNPPDRHGEHPTEKPLRLMRELVGLFTNHGDLVCDPFMGSGTTGMAATAMGRRFVGIERDPKWFSLAMRRIEEAQRQSDLFIKPAGAAA